MNDTCRVYVAEGMPGKRNCPFCRVVVPVIIESRSLKSFTAAPSRGCRVSFSKTVPRIFNIACFCCAKVRVVASKNRSEAMYLIILPIPYTMTPQKKEGLIRSVDFSEDNTAALLYFAHDKGALDGGQTLYFSQFIEHKFLILFHVARAYL